MIIYSQSLGKVWFNSLIIGSGYSGNGDALNNPALENIVGHGPIPRGLWEIVRWTGDSHYTDNGGHDLGPQVAILKPVDFNPHDRAGLLWHGDNKLMNFTASNGCIISPRVLRDHLSKAWDLDLEAKHLQVIG